MKQSWRRFLSYVCLATTISCVDHSAEAAILASSDSLRLAHLVQNLVQLMQDMNFGARAAGSNSQECLINMISDVTNVTDHMEEIADLVYLSINMHLPADEVTVLSMLNRVMVFSRKDLDNSRNSIILSEGHCGHDSFVDTEARAAVGMISESDAIIRALQSKLGSM